MKLSEHIDLEFNRSNAIKLLGFGTNPENSPYTHKQIAEWCDRFWCKYLDVDAENEIEELLPILTDVETQWDLYLANKYSIEELRVIDMDNEIMPKEWFNEWLSQLA